MEPHSHWKKRGSWGKPETHIVLHPSLSGKLYYALCGQCGRHVFASGKACYAEASIDGFPDQGCGAWFTAITSPYERLKDECEQVRPDLNYKVLEWA